MHDLKEFLRTSYTAYHAVDNAKAALLENGFLQLLETDDWTLCEGGKYFVVRNGGSIIAFTIGSLDRFSYKIAAAHTDSPALKLKEHPEKKSGAYLTLNVETYGVGIWYSFLDRPLKIAGRVVKREGAQLCAHTVESDFLVSIPSLAVHQNRTVNDNFAIQKQVDLLPLYSLYNENIGVVEKIAGNGVVSYDLYAVNADMPYSFGANNEFLASPRIDNLTSAYATLQGLLSHSDSDGVCVAAIFDNEEIGSGTSHGADGDFLENTLKRIAYAFHFDDGEYYKALADSFLLSIDNAHATHPNHPEKSDPTNEVKLGGGVVIKTHAGKAYLTDALSSAVVKTIMENAGVPYQTFFNHSDVRSGGTLGAFAIRHVGVRGADIGLAQLAMHSACESFAKADYESMVKCVATYFSSSIAFEGDNVSIG
jgi:aspartyl aminopeptidase